MLINYTEHKTVQTVKIKKTTKYQERIFMCRIIKNYKQNTNYQYPVKILSTSSLTVGIYPSL